MSDFSAGIFILYKDKDKVFPFLTEGEFFIQYNAQWAGKLSPLDTGYDLPPQTMALSKETPLLHIIHAEDHGFSMRIIHNAAVTFTFEMPYMAQAELAHEIGNELFGEAWFLDTDKAPERYRQADVEAAKRLKEQGIPGIYFTPNHEESLRAFQVFGIGDETIQNLRSLLNVENFKKDAHEMIYAALDALGLTQFSFVAHDYVSGDDDRFVFLTLRRGVNPFRI